MDQDAQISWEEYIPTDRYAIQDMYLVRIHQLSLLYERLMRAHFQGAIDTRTLVDFFALADAFYWFARENIKKHMTETDLVKLVKIFESGRLHRPGKESVQEAIEVYKLFQTFAYKSKLTDLTAKRWKGEFANARRKLGIGGQAE